MLFHPSPNKTLTLSAIPASEENSLLPDLAVLGRKEAGTNSTGNAAASSPEAEHHLLRGKPCETEPFPARRLGHSTNAVWGPASACWALGLGAKPCAQLPDLRGVVGCNLQLKVTTEHPGLDTSILRPSSRDAINAAGLWNCHTCWHQGPER